MLSTETGASKKHIKTEVDDKDRRFSPKSPMRTLPEDALFIDLTASSQESPKDIAVKIEVGEGKDEPRKPKARLTTAQTVEIEKAQWEVVHNLTKQFRAQETALQSQAQDAARHQVEDGHDTDEEEVVVVMENEEVEEETTATAHKRNLSTISSTSPDRPKQKRVSRARSARETLMNQLEKEAEERNEQRANRKKKDGNMGGRGGKSGSGRV